LLPTTTVWHLKLWKLHWDVTADREKVRVAWEGHRIVWWIV
jgi:hypothetical protein